MNVLRLSRRALLGGAASLAIASALRTFRAEAQAAAPIRRIVLFFTPHGTVFDRWRPIGTRTDFNLPYILEPLNGFKDRLNIIEGMGLKAGGPGAPHTRGPAVLFTGSPLADDGTFNRSDCSGGCSYGWNTHHSVDQEIANRLGTATPYGSLEFGVVSGGGFPGAHINYKGPARPVSPKQDPYVAFQQLFADRQLSEADRAKELTRKTDILATVQDDLARFEGKIALDDYRRLEAHAQALSEIQRALQSSLAACTIPATPEQRAVSSAGFKPWAIDRHIEILAASLACGLTRVASLQYRVGENDGGTHGIYDWLGHTSEHHLTSHDRTTEAFQRLSEIYRWYAGRFAYLLQKLDSFPEGDGTLLDHTLVVWGSELGDGWNHDIKSVPFVVAGGQRAGIRGGQSLRYTTPIYNNRLLVSLCQFMGYSDVTSFGTFDDGSGRLDELFV